MVDMIQCLEDNWNNILSLVISGAALGTSIYANHRVNSLKRQEMQEPLYKELKVLLSYKCDYFSSEQKLIDCYTKSSPINKEEENRIKREVFRYFGADKYRQLCAILDLCEKAKNIDSDLGILFELIKKSNPQQYSQLKEFLLLEYSDHINEQDYKNYQNFLSTISIPYYKLNDNDPGKAYDYLTLNSQLISIHSEIQEKKEKFDNRLKADMKKR